MIVNSAKNPEMTVIVILNSLFLSVLLPIYYHFLLQCIGGYESAWLADLVGAYILANTNHCFNDVSYYGLYRDDDIGIFKGQWNYQRILNYFYFYFILRRLGTVSENGIDFNYRSVTLCCFNIIPRQPNFGKADVKLFAGTTSLVGKFPLESAFLWSLINNFGDGIAFDLID